MYHFSDLKTLVTGAKQVQSTAQQARDKVVASMSNTSPSDALQSLRALAKSYAGFIPGFGAHVDATFDEIQGIVDTHGDAANDIIKKAYDEVTDAVKKGGLDVETASKLADILGRRAGELKELGKKAGLDVLGNHPEVKEKIGGSYEQLAKLAGEKGPAAKKALEDVQKQVRRARASSSPGLTRRS